MTQLKKVIFSIFGMALLATGFVACSSDDNATTKNEEKVEVNEVKSNSVERFHYSDFEFIGVEHNAILGGVLEDIIKDSNIKNEDLGIEMSNYIFEKSSKLISSDKEVEYSKHVIDEMIYNPIDVTKNLYPIEKQDILSDNSKVVLDELHKVLFSENEISIMINDIEEIERLSYNDVNLTNSDLYVIFTATSIAKNTIEYWEVNYDNWSSALKERESLLENNYTLLAARKKGIGRHFAEIVAADVGGGVFAAAGAWIVNVVPGWGQIAYGGAIVMGAVSGSGGVATLKIADQIFDSYENTRNYR